MTYLYVSHDLVSGAPARRSRIAVMYLGRVMELARLGRPVPPCRCIPTRRPCCLLCWSPIQRSGATGSPPRGSRRTHAILTRAAAASGSSARSRSRSARRPASSLLVPARDRCDDVEERPVAHARMLPHSLVRGLCVAGEDRRPDLLVLRLRYFELARPQKDLATIGC